MPKKRKRFAQIPFQLSLARADLIRLRDHYLAKPKEVDRERGAFEAGRRIAAGEYSKGPLEAILVWKSSRPKSLLAGNSEADVADALRLAVMAATERSAIAVLCGLRGVEIPVASAVLTTIDPERFTVIDVRVLETLGVKLDNLTVERYLQYLRFCKSKTSELGLSLRDLDRALWQSSKNRTSARRRNR